MTDTKMKTLGELAKELRGHCAEMVSPTGRARKGIEAAADRLERIERAWADCERLDGSADWFKAHIALRAAIEGEP